MVAFTKRKGKAANEPTPDVATTDVEFTSVPAKPKTGSKKLGEHLLSQGIITTEQLSQALIYQGNHGGRIGEILVNQKALTEQQLASALGELFGYDVIDLRKQPIDASVLQNIPEDLARRYSVVPFQFSNGVLDVAVAEPDDGLKATLGQRLNMPISLHLAPLGDIRWVIDSNYQAIGTVDKLIQAFETAETSRRRTSDTVAEDLIISEDAPVVQLVDRILTQAMRDRASDVHIEPSEEVVRVRFRIDGALKEVLSMPASIGPGLVSRIKIMANMNIVERRRPQDGQLTIAIDGNDVDVRVATTATIMGESCVMRILDKTRSVLRLNELGMPTDTHLAYSKLVRSPFGMVLCAGPTGSGKTTTLYATLSEVTNPTVNVMTIEDPVEYVFPQINQIQTNEQAGLTFATGLKSILRQDPDVILVGEIRDVETTRVAVQSALTGHFVASSLHATDAVSALHRLLDMGIEAFLIASSVLGVVGQRLLRRICPSCKVEYEPTLEELEFFHESGGTPLESYVHGVGCTFCSHTGYKDRIGVYELLIMTPEIRRLVVGWATQEELRTMAVRQGMRTMRQEAIALVEQGVTTIEEVIRSMYTL
ncbi:MAG: Flp pilus assembly complex ATPase component TadA [Acidobacteria bacterium]|nr:Flp pilus assembly complex ATPase component TadA [Acidobacteriota bacterium]